MDADDQAFAEVIGAARKHVVASSPTDLGWNAERVAGDLVASVRRLRDETEGMILLGGVTLPAALPARRPRRRTRRRPPAGP